MGKLVVIVFSAVAVLFHSCFLGCWATVYTVGDNSGWDISTDLDSWAKDKTFSVGDTLLFQYSQYHSLSEVTKEAYDGCNTTNPLMSSSNGNTTVVLTRYGDRYFVCGNILHCLGGMKLHVNVVQGNLPESPAGAPQPGSGGHATGALPPGSSKANHQNNSGVVKCVEVGSLVLTAFVAFLVSSRMA